MDQDPDPGLPQQKGTDQHRHLQAGRQACLTITQPVACLPLRGRLDAARDCACGGESPELVYSGLPHRSGPDKVAAQSVTAGSDAKAGDFITYQLSKKGPQASTSPGRDRPVTQKSGWLPNCTPGRRL